MSAGRANLMIPILAVVAFAAILGWFGYARFWQDPKTGRTQMAERAAESVPAPAKMPAPDSQPTARANLDPSASPPAVAGADTAPTRSNPTLALPPSSVTPEAAPPSPTASGTNPRQGDAIEPAFDVVRVEPSGDSVIAGRAVPGAVVELLSNGASIARVVADGAGQFAFVPPPLPPGSHELLLQSVAPNSGRSRSEQSVTVVIASGRTEAPLVVVTRPGQPTVILSQPDAPARVAALPAASPSAASPLPGSGPGAGASPPSAGDAPPLPTGPRPEIRIASVETEGKGRLYVSGLAAPGATIRLYLNDAFVAPGASAADGRLAFSIERGIRPGEYRVRLDDVDPASGVVRSRAEAPFRVPAPPVPGVEPPLPPVAERPGLPPGKAVEVQPSSPAVAPDALGRPPAPQMQPASPSTVAGLATPQPSSLPTRSPAGSPILSAAAPTPTPSAPDLTPSDPGAVSVPEVNTTIVGRGDNLWRISKRSYGQGLRYTVIFGANTPQIRNPHLIYPGQIFVLPNNRAEAVIR